jgi:hypothetical protein
MNNKAINIQQPEKVILFDGEEDFVISRGGNNSQYLMVDGGRTDAPQPVTRDLASSTDDPRGTSGGTVSGGRTPATGLVFDVPDWGSLNCPILNTQIANLTSYLSLTQDLSADQRAYYENQLAIAKGTYAQKCAIQQPPTYSVPDFSTMSCDTLKTELDKLKSWFQENQSKLGIEGISNYGNAIKNGNSLYAQKCETPQYPKFEVPNWATLSCEQLKTKIEELDKYFKEYSSKFTSLDSMFYDGALSNARTIYETKCKAAPPPPAPTTTVTTTTSYIPTFGGGVFGGGGRGGSANMGEKPKTDVNNKVTVQKKGLSSYWWLLLLVGVAGYVYYKNKEKKGK